LYLKFEIFLKILYNIYVNKKERKREFKMTKQERYELLVKCCEEFGNILDNAFESGMMSEEDMSDAESTENALWAVANSLKEEIESEDK
jgi:hypothetical protein